MSAPMRLAPCVPHWVMAQRETEMHIDNQFVHCSAFLGMPLTDGRFHVEGTGFFYRIDEGGLIFSYLISAKHVVRDYFYRRPGGALAVRVQRKLGLAPKLFDTTSDDWLDNPDSNVDISVYEVPWGKWDLDNDLNIIALMNYSSEELERLLANAGFGLGSEVFIPSAYAVVPGEKQNFPVVRFGRISAMPSEPLWVASPTR